MSALNTREYGRDGQDHNTMVRQPSILDMGGFVPKLRTIGCAVVSLIFPKSKMCRVYISLLLKIVYKGKVNFCSGSVRLPLKFSGYSRLFVTHWYLEHYNMCIHVCVSFKTRISLSKNCTHLS